MTKNDRDPWSGSGWKLGDTLGRGTFARVYSAKNVITGKEGAVKVISKDNEDNTPEVIDAEIEIMRLVTERLRGSSGVVKLRQALEDSINVYVVTEVCHGGTLADMIESRGHFDEEDAKVVTRQVLETLADLHCHKFIHCDLKPENVLLTDGKDNLTNLKITDFGLSLCETSSAEQPLMGSPLYVAPEVLTRQQYSPAVDVWALGILTYHMLCGRVPFASDTKTKENKLRFYDEVWEGVSSDAKAFIGRCLEKVTLERATTSELLRHPWLQQLGGNVHNPPLIRHLSRQLSANKSFSTAAHPPRALKKMNSGYTPDDLFLTPKATTASKNWRASFDSDLHDDHGSDEEELGHVEVHNAAAGCLFSQATESIPPSRAPHAQSPLKDLDWSDTDDSEESDDDDFWRLGAGQRQHAGRIRRAQRMAGKPGNRHSAMDRRIALVLQGRGYL